MANTIAFEARDELVQRPLYTFHRTYYPDTKDFYVVRQQRRREYVLIYCVEGKGWYELDGEEYTVSENQVCILPANKPHRYGADKENPWSIYWILTVRLRSKTFSGEGFIIALS